MESCQNPGGDHVDVSEKMFLSRPEQTCLGEPEVEEDILTRSVSDEKAIIRVCVTCLENVFISILEKPAIRM